MFDFGEDLFNRVEVWTVGRQEEQVRAFGTDSIASRFTLVTAEIVEDDDLALCQGWHKHLLDIEREEFTIDGSVDDPRGADPIVTECRDEGHGRPVAIRCCCFETLPSCAPAAKGRHVGFDPGLIDEDQARRVNLALVGLPARSFAGDIRPILFSRQNGFF
jgi:hypothetical protein